MPWSLFSPSTQNLAPSDSSRDPSTPQQHQPPVQTRDQEADAELTAFLQSLAENQNNQQPGQSFVESPSPSTSTSASSSHSQTPLTRAHIYPSEISCRALFDQAFYCQSLGGKFLEIYRYGRTKSCSQHWSNFWWCMRTNRSGSLSETERQELIRQRYWEQDERLRRQPEGSSEDIWQQRQFVLDQGHFFTPLITGPGALRNNNGVAGTGSATNAGERI